MPYLFDAYALDPGRRELKRSGELIPLEPQVFDLLVYLIENRDRVVSKDDVIASVWQGRIVSESTLTSRINAARKAIGDSGDQQNLIRTIARKGFRFVGTLRDEPRGARRAGAGGISPARPAVDRCFALRQYERRSGAGIFL